MIEKGLSAKELKLAFCSAREHTGEKTDLHFPIFWGSQRFCQASAVPNEQHRGPEQPQCPAEAPTKSGLKRDRQSLVLYFSPEMHLPMERTASRTVEGNFPRSPNILLVEKLLKKADLWPLLQQPFGDFLLSRRQMCSETCGSARSSLRCWWGWARRAAQPKVEYQ